MNHNSTGEKSRRKLSSVNSTSNLNQKIVLNVGGKRFHTFLGTLKNIPHTRLCWLAEKHPLSPEYDHAVAEYFFDRHPDIFSEVLNYYRTGKLHCPTHLCALQYSEELAFWGINSQNMEPCCWVHYHNRIKNDKSLQSYGAAERAVPGARGGLNETAGLTRGKTNKPTMVWKKYQKLVWAILEQPNFSKASKAYVILSSMFILLMLLQFCLGSLASFQDDPNKMYILKILFATASIFFTLELFLRILFCPNKVAFLKSLMNWIDLLTILPYYVSLVTDDQRIIWLLPFKLLQLYRLFSLSDSFQVMVKAIVASANELFLGMGTIIIPVILFSCLIYLAEKDHNPEMFANVPESFWWAIVTITTLGYGDKVPRTVVGKAIGIACALCGVVIIALPISVIGNNFYLHFTQARARKKKPLKETIATGMAHLPLMNLRVLHGSPTENACWNNNGDATAQIDETDNKIGSKTRRKLVAIS